MIRHRLRLLLAFSALLPAAAFTQSDSTLMITHEERAVLAAEDAYVAAELARDEAALKQLVDDSFVQNLSSGKTSGKEELIHAVMNLPMVGQDIRERTVHLEGDVALVFGTADIHFAPPGKDKFTSSLRYTSTYVNRDGQWRMLALQMQARED